MCANATMVAVDSRARALQGTLLNDLRKTGAMFVNACFAVNGAREPVEITTI